MADVSGLYERQDSSDTPFTLETLRLDVDGPFPQMAASGTGLAGLTFRTHWVASPLTATVDSGGTTWRGAIFYKNGNNGLLPYAEVAIRFISDKLEATFTGPGLPDRIRSFTLKSSFFHDVEFEFDFEQGITPVLNYQTHSHPDRPTSLANELLSISDVYERAGFRVTNSGGDSPVPVAEAGTNTAWSDNEMHDAMQVHFSRIAGLPSTQQNRARWALWTFFAGLHEEGTSLGGIMFDSIGPAERQGTALFLNSFIKNPPAGEQHADAWIRRMAFWTAVHEMGHGFNLLHSWDKDDSSSPSWIPISGGYDQLTYMNYPYLYQTGSFSDANTARFFKRFGFRFTDDELLFLRHAPERFVIMGGERFASNHAFEQANVSPIPTFQLEVRVNRASPAFEFMEPVVIEIKLTNVSSQPVLIPEHFSSGVNRLTLLIETKHGERSAYRPYAEYCRQSKATVLEPNASVYESVFVSAGLDGWSIDDPGYYSIQACLQTEDEDVLSNMLSLRILPPRSWDEEYLAQDYFSDDVGRVIAFDGTQVLESANNILQEVVEKLHGSKVAIHAQVALSVPRLDVYKKLTTVDMKGHRYQVKHVAPKESSMKDLAKVLGMDSKDAGANAATALGHIDFNAYAQQCSAALAEHGDKRDAKEVLRCACNTLRDRKVLPSVIGELESMIGKTEPVPTKTPGSRTRPPKRKR